MQLRVIPTVVGLRVLDDCPIRRRHFTEGVSALKRFESVLDREFDINLLLNSPGSPGVIDDELPGELVEGTAAVVGDVSDVDGHSQQPILRDLRDPKYVITRIRIQIGAQLERVAVSVSDRGDLAIKSVAMFPRPLNLRSTPAKVDSHSHLHTGGRST